MLDKPCMLRAIATFVAMVLPGCSTLTPQQCMKQCSDRGLRMSGMQSKPTTASHWGEDTCLCAPATPAVPTSTSTKQLAPAPPPQALPGCGKDTDCKGLRVCRQGSCEDP